MHVYVALADAVAGGGGRLQRTTGSRMGLAMWVRGKRQAALREWEPWLNLGGGNRGRRAVHFPFWMLPHASGCIIAAASKAGSHG